MKKTIGIVGGGIAGLTCAYRLQNEFDVTLFEKDKNVGGQAQTKTVNGVHVESAVSVVAEITYREFFELMREIGFTDFEPYSLTGLHAHDRRKTLYYFDTNLARLAKLLPKYLKDTPTGGFHSMQLAPFFYQLYRDHQNGRLDNTLVMDAYTQYPMYKTLITTVLTILSLITSVQAKNSTISHVLNFIFDFDNNNSNESLNPLTQVFRLFKDVTVPRSGTGAYIERLKSETTASYYQDQAVTSVRVNTDSSVTVVTGNESEHRFDAVVIATQPFQVASFLSCRNEREEDIFNRLSHAITRSMVTNHTDETILEGVGPVEGLVDFRIDYHENASQTTIARRDHFYTAQTLPDNYNEAIYTQATYNQGQYLDTAVTPDNYSINQDKILSQHLHAVQNMTPEIVGLLNEINRVNGKDNLYFASAALSRYPTSQEGGVRSANKVAEDIIANVALTPC